MTVATAMYPDQGDEGGSEFGVLQAFVKADSILYTAMTPKKNSSIKTDPHQKEITYR